MTELAPWTALQGEIHQELHRIQTLIFELQRRGSPARGAAKPAAPEDWARCNEALKAAQKRLHTLEEHLGHVEARHGAGSDASDACEQALARLVRQHEDLVALVRSEQQRGGSPSPESDAENEPDADNPHQGLLDSQSRHLDELHSSILRQQDVALNIHNELQYHAVLLDDTDETRDRAQSRLRGVRRRLSHVVGLVEERGILKYVIALLLLSLFILGVVHRLTAH